MKHNANNGPITAPRRALISVVNGTKKTLQVNNNIVANMGPNKGKWMLHQELVLSPKACATTQFLLDASHQLMIYDNAQSEKFLYKIDANNIDNNQTVELFEESYNIVPNLLSI